ncbi:hypothetical protein [Psychrobacter submarinus]|jgi:hypothetical protein|uniref:hypothetical protein n=1 Tax=Psychrobacter submarinus TaxID=154108 RepID=UPI001D127639|nr:hypothetical protein [Psychrobacter submarinus]
MKPLYLMLSMFAIGLTSTAALAEATSIPDAASLPNVSPANSDLVNRGAYIARAADCMACHGDDYVGGNAIETPMGDIYSTNITPSKQYGIGKFDPCRQSRIYKLGRF